MALNSLSLTSDLFMGLAMLAIFWPLLAFGAALLAGPGHYLRTIAQLKLARSLGWDYADCASPELVEILKTLDLFTFPHVQKHIAGQYFRGRLSDKPIELVYFHFMHGSWGMKRSAWHQTIAVIRGAHSEDIGFAVWKRQNVLSALGDVVAGPVLGGGHLDKWLSQEGRIKLPDNSKFNQRFAILGYDEAQVRQIFTPEVVDLIMKNDLTASLQGGCLVVFRENQVVTEPDQMLELANAAIELSNALPNSGSSTGPKKA